MGATSLSNDTTDVKMAKAEVESLLEKIEIVEKKITVTNKLEEADDAQIKKLIERINYKIGVELISLCDEMLKAQKLSTEWTQRVRDTRKKVMDEHCLLADLDLTGKKAKLERLKEKFRRIAKERQEVVYLSGRRVETAKRALEEAEKEKAPLTNKWKEFADRAYGEIAQGEENLTTMCSLYSQTVEDVKTLRHQYRLSTERRDQELKLLQDAAQTNEELRSELAEVTRRNALADSQMRSEAMEFDRKRILELTEENKVLQLTIQYTERRMAEIRLRREQKLAESQRAAETQAKEGLKSVTSGDKINTPTGEENDANKIADVSRNDTSESESKASPRVRRKFFSFFRK